MNELDLSWVRALLRDAGRLAPKDFCGGARLNFRKGAVASANLEWTVFKETTLRATGRPEKTRS